MASSFPPKKGAAFTLYFTLYKNDGTVIANPGTMTRAVSIDGGAVDTTPANAITEEDTTYGQISWVLSADEMNGDAIWVYAKDDTAGCVPFTATLYTAAQTLDEVYSRIGAPAGASIAADLVTIDNFVDDLESRLTAARAGYLDALNTGVPVASIANGAVTAAAVATGAIDADAIAADAVTEIQSGLSTLNAAGIRTAVGLASADLDTQLAALPTDADVETAAGAALATYDPPTKAEMDSALAGLASDTDVADAVWDELLSGHTSAGTAGLLLGTTLPAAIDAVDNYVDSEIGTLTTELAKVPKSDGSASWNATALAAIQSEATDALNAYDPPTATELTNGLAALNDLDAAGVRGAVGMASANLDTQLGALPTAAENADAVWDEASTGHTDAGKAGQQMWTDVDAILADTNELQGNQGDWATADVSGLSTFDPASDVVAHVTLVDTTTTNTDMVTAAPAAADVADAVWDEALAGHAGAGTAGAALSAAGTAGDPWSIDIPGSYADGTAGQKLGDIMDDLEDGGRTDLLIDAIKAQTDALDGYTVTVVSPVADSGTVTLYAGDDYDDAHGRALTFSLAVSGVPDLTAATVVMKTQESSWTATSCTSDGTDWTVLFEPTAADTAALGNLRQTYEVEATLSDGDVATLVTGTLVVNRDVA